VWNPESFFNTMVVNGNTWPVLEVAPERYRFRMLNASDSRFLNLAMFQVKSNGGIFTNRELPFYQIGAEQSLLPQVVRVETGFATPLPGNGQNVCTTGGGKPKGNGKGAGNAACVPAVPGIFAEQALLIGPAERADTIVDFTGLANGTRIRVINTAPDAPFGGFPDVPADPATTGQVMEFVVNTALSNPAGDPSTPAPSLVLNATAPGGDPKLGPDTNPLPRDLALLEEESALLCVTIDAVTGVITQVAGTPPNCPAPSLPFAPKAAVLGIDGSLGAAGATVTLWDDPIETNPGVNDVETWELWNQTVDSHPIHLHLVKFEVVSRQLIGGPAVQPGTGVQPWERGWKDTVIAYPGEVTRVKAQFDIPGLYVWHCHILSHEDNEMMVPYCVGTPGVDCPAELF
jgi:FtsP/CotA-like multicopper oxidase with cupredoxin domain